MEITFRKLELEDLQLLHKWLNEGPVLQWYSKQPSTLEEVKEKYTPRIEGKTKTDHYVIMYKEEPIGYIQTYRVTDYPEWNQYVEVGEDAAGLDLFIGENEYRGQGLGSQVIREFLNQVVFKGPSITTCISGPDPLNTASKRAFEKAGFKYFKTINPPEGEEYLMKITKSDL